jgi:Protein of unknown function (DUF1800).
MYRQLGQVPFYPPNVKGWDGGKSWINTGTLTYRYLIARALISGVKPEQVGLPKFPPKTTSPNWDPAGRSTLASMQLNRAVGTSGPAATPFPPLTSPWPVEKYIDPKDRNDPKRLLKKLYTRIFQSKPQLDLLKNFIEVASTKTLPFDDDSIRDLAMLMMTTPNYQVS